MLKKIDDERKQKEQIDYLKQQHEEFKKYTDEMIDNSGTIEETSIQIQKKLVL